MMSYLWILLIGSLLAASATAQEEAADLENPAPEVNPATEVNGDPDADEETAKETLPTASEPEPSAEPDGEADEQVTPAGDEEPTPPADDDAGTPAPADDDAGTPAPADDDAGTPAPADDEAETPAPTDDDAGTPAPADDDTEEDEDDAETPAPVADDEEPAGFIESLTPTADTGAEADATTEVPAADPDVGEPEVEQTTANVEEVEPSTDSFPASEESEPGDKAVEGNEEEPTDPPAEAEVTDQFVKEELVPDVRHEVMASVPTDDVDNIPDEDGMFNLEDALSDNSAHSGKSRMLESGAHVAGAKGDADKPQPRASSGSLAGILCAIGVAAVGAVTGYFTYQRKQLCFKNRQEADPEAARKADVAEAQSDPQVLSNLLNSS